jgi:hypothetical protein
VDAVAPGRGTGRPPGRDPRLPGDRAQGAEKKALKPWRVERFCIPERDGPRFSAVATRLCVDPHRAALDVHGVDLDHLSLRQASELIDHLRSQAAAAANGY